MIARTRLSSVGQVAGVALAALGCYLVSQTVAAERAALAKVDRQIAEARDSIARLETEIGVRSRQPQLERWNGQVLSLKAPQPRQFVADSVQLVSEFSIGPRQALPLNPAITSQQVIDKVSYQPGQATIAPAPRAPEEAPQPPAATIAQAPQRALLQTASFVRPKADRMAPDAPEIVKASYRPVITPDPVQPAAAPAKAATVKAIAKAEPARADRPKAVVAKADTKPAPAPKAAAAKRPTALASLLPADIGKLAAAEKAGGKAAR